jgi:hypothetical protein
MIRNVCVVHPIVVPIFTAENYDYPKPTVLGSNHPSRKPEQLLTMDILALATMKNAAKCDT